VTKVVLAKLSPTMEEGSVVSWSVQEGDTVRVGDVLAEIETDKANMEMEALGTGILRKILVPAGGKAPVGTLIGVIAEADEDIEALLAEAEAHSAAELATPAPAVAAAFPPPAAPAPSPAVSVAPVAATSSVVSFPTGGRGGRIKSSPLARAIAASRNVPLETISGSGPGGRIIKRDVEGYLAAPLTLPTPTTPVPADRALTTAPVAPAVVPGTEVALSNMRRTIARRLSESKFSAPHFYVSVDVTMGRAVTLRKLILEAEEVKVSYNDLVVKACAKALARFPMVNASWAEDRIITHAGVHVGVAVAIPDGLLTPVVRDADRKSVVEISREIKELAGRARERRLRPEEFTGSTFTVSNLGMLDVTEFTAIINPPESCILAVGAVRKEPVAVEDRVEVGHRMKLTLSADHRAIDGALAARFLGEIRRLLEKPISVLV
jgi:pyruvate dehydrogenase E2 component (dihydrolipoamide acetyltransferase)